MAFEITDAKNFEFGNLTVRIRRFSVKDVPHEQRRLGWLAMENDLLKDLSGDVTFLFHCAGKYASLEQYAEHVDTLTEQFDNWVEADKSKPIELLLFHYKTN